MTKNDRQHGFPELFIRHDANPILSTADWPYPANTVFNAGATRLESGETLLLVRVEDRRGISHLTAARSSDGISNWLIDSQPTLMPDSEEHPEEMWGVEDPRVVYLPETQQYAVTYTSYSRHGPLVSLALTKDFVSWQRKGALTVPENKDAALFPRRFGNRWALLHRPAPGGTAHIWISFSPDLRHWGEHQVVLEARSGGWWDAEKIGLSPPPIETEDGWLVIYHGVRMTVSGAIYRLGLALLDLEDPRRVIRRGDEWVFGPEAPYERVGDVGNVAFPCGTVLMPEAGSLRLYYGAADTSIALATGNLDNMLDWLKLHGQ
ncbi:MAG: glycosidase [Acidobacteriota bacterium]